MYILFLKLLITVVRKSNEIIMFLYKNNLQIFESKGFVLKKGQVIKN